MRSRASEKILMRDGAGQEYAERIDLLRSRATLLTGKDRLLMQMYLDRANTFAQMARLAGVNEANVARRIYKITRRLLDGQYITCLRRNTGLSERQRQIARAYLVAGTPMRKIAVQFGTSYYAIRKLMRKIQDKTRV